MKISVKKTQGDLPEPETPVEPVLMALSVEMKAMAQTCTELQWLISTLLERAHHPDLPSEMHMLQDIDRIQQTLIDMAAVVETLSRPTAALSMPTSELASCLKLDSLRARIIVGENQPDNAKEITGQPTDITWL